MSKNFKKSTSQFPELLDIDSINLNTRSNQNFMSTQLVDSKTFVFNNYNITMSYTSDDNIFMNIINTITFQNYEGIIRDSDITSNLSLELFNTLVNKSFGNQPNYKVVFQVENNFIKINFTAILDGFFPIIQTIELREKVLSGDKALTLKLTEMEAKYKSEINELKKQIDELKNEEIIFAINPNKFGDYLKYSTNSKEFNFTKFDDWNWIGNYIDFNKLTCLTKIIIFDKNFNYQKTIKDIYTPQRGNIENHTYDASGWQFYENYLQNIFDSPQIFLPSVTELEIKFLNNARIFNDNLRSLPNLKKITWNNFANNQLVSFPLIKNLTNLKHIIFLTCLNIHELDQIKNWCDSKGIKLEIK